jgi:hypothetical protein
LKYIRGVILPQARSGTAGEYNIMPLYPGPSQLSGSKYPGDVVIDKFAPSITNFTKYPGVPKSTDVVNITYRAKDPNTNGPVDSTLFCYKVGLAGSWVKTKVTTPDSIYRATIPASANDSIVSYYVEAYASGQIGMFPDASIPYFYRIRNTGLTIYDLQYTPYVNGRSGFTGDTVTVTGVLVLDTTMFKENVSRPRFYMSSGTGAWKGICMYGINAAVGLDTLKKADSVSVTGILRESYSKTEIQVLSYVLLKRGATVPAANSVSISGSGSLSYEITNPPVDGTARFEQWEGCLITISNPYVVVRNADNPSGGAGSNYGEFFVSSSALGTANAKYGIRVNDYGTYKYYADTSASYTAKEPNPILLPLGCKISFITGVLDYSYSNYKLEPRDNNDFGTITSVEPKRIAAPADYELSQNYPNPFNPTTEIRYSIPSNNRVTIKIYNILGQVVRTVVDADHAAGTYAARFNANGLASGMYIYQMKAGDYVVAKKMMLLK